MEREKNGEKAKEEGDKRKEWKRETDLRESMERAGRERSDGHTNHGISKGVLRTVSSCIRPVDRASTGARSG